MEENWQINDIGICIEKAEGQPLRLHAEYVVQGIRKCPCCGLVMLDIGMDTVKGAVLLTCCNAKEPLKSDIWWFKHTRFRKKKTTHGGEMSNETSDSILEKMRTGKEELRT